MGIYYPVKSLKQRARSRHAICLAYSSSPCYSVSNWVIGGIVSSFSPRRPSLQYIVVCPLTGCALLLLSPWFRTQSGLWGAADDCILGFFFRRQSIFKSIRKDDRQQHNFCVEQFNIPNGISVGWTVAIFFFFCVILNILDVFVVARNLIGILWDVWSSFEGGRMIEIKNMFFVRCLNATLNLFFF